MIVYSNMSATASSRGKILSAISTSRAVVILSAIATSGAKILSTISTPRAFLIRVRMGLSHCIIGCYR